MDGPVLVDSSVWVDALRERPTGTGVALDALLTRGRVVTAAIVAQEVLQGVREPGHYARISTLLSALPRANADWRTHLRAAALWRKLCAGGLTAPTIDALIAQLALDRRVSVWSLDTHFGAIARMTKLRLHRPQVS
jgi:predicted nucleic acid-binding protein